jgi:uncharacterized protein YjdB
MHMRVNKKGFVLLVLLVVAFGGSVQAAVSPTPKKVPVLKPSTAPKPSATGKPTTPPTYTSTPNPTEKKVTSVKVTPATVTMYEGQSVKLSAVVQVMGGASKDLKWTSSSTAIKVVNGLLTAGSFPKGKTKLTVKITATSVWNAKISGSSTVQLLPKVAVQRVAVNPSVLKLKLRQTKKLTYTISPANATTKTVTWATGNKEIASVDSNGNVTAKKVGTTKITVISNDGSKTSVCSVTVTK